MQRYRSVVANIRSISFFEETCHVQVSIDLDNDIVLKAD